MHIYLYVAHGCTKIEQGIMILDPAPEGLGLVSCTHRGGTIELCPEANEVTLNGQLPCNQEGVALSSFLCPANHANLTVLGNHICNL